MIAGQKIGFTIFLKWSTQGLVFNVYSKVKHPKVGSFSKALEDIEGLRSEKNLIFHNFIKQK